MESPLMILQWFAAINGPRPCVFLIILLSIFTKTETAGHAIALCTPLAELDTCKLFDKQYKMHTDTGVRINTAADPWTREQCIQWCLDNSSPAGNCHAVEIETDVANTPSPGAPSFAFDGACWKFVKDPGDSFWKYKGVGYEQIYYVERYIYLSDHQFSPGSNHCPPEVLVDEINGCVIQSYKGYKGADGFHYANITNTDYIDCRDLCLATPTRCHTFAHSEEAQECLLYEQSKSFILQRDNKAYYAPDLTVTGSATDFKKPEYNYYRFECMTDHLPGKSSARDKSRFLSTEECGYMRHKNMSCANHASLEVVSAATTATACHVACIDSPRCVAFAFNKLTSDCRHCGYEWDPLESATDYTVYTPICNCDEEPDAPACIPWNAPPAESCTVWTAHARRSFNPFSNEKILGQWGSRINDCVDACLDGATNTHFGVDCNMIVYDFNTLDDPFNMTGPTLPIDWAYGDYRCAASNINAHKDTTYSRYAFCKVASSCPTSNPPENVTVNIDDEDYTFCLTRYPDHSNFMGTGFGKVEDDYGNTIDSEEKCKDACLDSLPPNICHGFSFYSSRNLGMDTTTDSCVFLEDIENRDAMLQVSGASLTIVNRAPC